MRISNTLAALFLVAASSVTTGAELNGNVDYSIETVNGSVRMTLKNKRPDTPVSLVQIAALQKARQGKDSVLVSLPTAKVGPIDQQLVLELGNAAELAEKILPDVNPRAYRSVVITDAEKCSNCDNKRLPIQLVLAFPGGTTQTVLASCVISYLLQ